MHLLRGPERIASAVYEHHGRSQIREMGGAQLLPFARRVKRIGDEQKPVRCRRIFRSEHTCLAAAVRLSAEDQVADAEGSHPRAYFAQAFAIFCLNRRMGSAGSPGLAEWQIHAKRQHAAFGKCRRKRNQEARVAV